MGVGKTTLGKRLALALKMPFIDTDKLVEEGAGMPVEQIFETRGEEAFRKMEADVLRTINNNAPSVVATGGGLPCYYNNMAFMNEHGFTTYIKAGPQFIYSRLIKAKKPRPLIKSLDKEELLAFISEKISDRKAYYELSKLQINFPENNTESLVNTIVSAYLKSKE
ncbi:MAG: shikimate kinase [Bacteroidota bacterium]